MAATCINCAAGAIPEDELDEKLTELLDDLSANSSLLFNELLGQEDATWLCLTTVYHTCECVLQHNGQAVSACVSDAAGAIPEEELDEKLTELLDDLLDNETLLNELGKEILFNRQLDDENQAMDALEGLQRIDQQLGEVLGGMDKK